VQLSDILHSIGRTLPHCRVQQWFDHRFRFFGHLRDLCLTGCVRVLIGATATAFSDKMTHQQRPRGSVVVVPCVVRDADKTTRNLGLLFFCPAVGNTSAVRCSVPLQNIDSSARTTARTPKIESSPGVLVCAPAAIRDCSFFFFWKKEPIPRTDPENILES